MMWPATISIAVVVWAVFLCGCQAGPNPVDAVGQALADTGEAANAARVGVIEAVGQREVKTSQKIYVDRLRPLGVIKHDSQPAATEGSEPSGGPSI